MLPSPLGRALVIVAALAGLGIGRSSAQPVPRANGEQVIARPPAGPVAGRRESGLSIYRGIPFAQPPVGSLRWAPPRPLPAWRQLRPATEFARACMQKPHAFMNVATQPVGEDCLYLNVWTPARGPGDRLPVLVWIHGGGFTYGSTAMPLFDGADLARRGVVFVSAAYRLGPFGFLAHPELTAESPHRASGNYALMDQVAALQWVRRNIAAFGGNPGRVTIMGESAGAVSVSHIAQSPLAKGLFHGVIAQSGAAFGVPGDRVKTLAAAEQEGLALAGHWGARTLKAMRAIPADQLLSRTPAGTGPFSLAGSAPIQDGYVVPDDPVRIYEAGRQNDTPVLLGVNDKEGALFVTKTTAKAFRTEVAEQYGPQAPQLLAAYPAGNDDQALDSAVELFGDSVFGVNAWTWARLQSRTGRGKVYYYHFNKNPPERPGMARGPIHGAELPYAFDHLDIRPLAWSDSDLALAKLMGDYWTNFARTGDPNGAGLPRWPVFEDGTPTVLWFNDEGATPGPVPHVERLKVLDTINTARRAALGR